MTEKMLKELKTEFVKFVWNGKKPKIKLKLLTMSKKDGGAGLVDLHAKDKSLKVSWIQILEAEPQLKRIVQINNLSKIGDKIWDCCLKSSEVHLFVTDSFWLQVYEAWFEFKAQNDNITKKEEQIIWLNSKIRVKGKPVLWNNCVLKGLLYVYQLFEEKQWITNEQAKNNYDLDIMDFNALKVAIPQEIKRLLKTKIVSPSGIMFSDVMKRKNNLTSTVYKSFLDTMSHSTVVEKWESELVAEIGADLFIQWINNGYKISNTTKLRSFHFRLLHRGLVNNCHLYRWGMRPNNLCTFCGKSKETYVHLFVMCEKVQPFWIKVEEMMFNFDNTAIEFNCTNVISSTLVNNIYSVKNSICLLAKSYIYRKRCASEKVKHQEFEKLVWKVKNIERYIAVKNGREKQHLTKWCRSSPNVTSSYFDMEQLT